MTDFVASTNLPTFSPLIAGRPHINPVTALADGAELLRRYSVLVERFIKAGWSVDFEREGTQPWLVLTAPSGMEHAEAVEQGAALAGDMAKRFYGAFEEAPTRS